MEWAQQDKTARPAEWARRLTFVRCFARHWSAHDPQTEVPPSGLLPYRPGRAHPYLYSNDEVRELLKASRQLPSTHGLGGRTYYCLLGLLAVIVQLTLYRSNQALDIFKITLDIWKVMKYAGVDECEGAPESGGWTKAARSEERRVGKEC